MTCNSYLSPTAQVNKDRNITALQDAQVVAVFESPEAI